MKRYAHIIEIRPGKIQEYKELHAAAWPEVLKRIEQSNIRNYSIYLKQLPDGKHYLFSYFEYIGNNFDTDMKAIAKHPKTLEWWAVCKPCQRPLPEVDVASGGWWADMEEVFHTD